MIIAARTSFIVIADLAKRRIKKWKVMMDDIADNTTINNYVCARESKIACI